MSEKQNEEKLASLLKEIEMERKQALRELDLEYDYLRREAEAIIQKELKLGAQGLSWWLLHHGLW